MAEMKDLFVDYSGVRPRLDNGDMVQKVLARGGKLMLAETAFPKKGAVLPDHSHDHEQVTYMVKGRLLFSVEGVRREIGPGDSVYIPANAVHGARVLEDGTVAVDAFTPQREDFLE